MLIFNSTNICEILLYKLHFMSEIWKEKKLKWIDDKYIKNQIISHLIRHEK